MITNQEITKPKIAVVIPVYKHSVLVAEAITCALNQDIEIPYKIVIVNDGCKFAETDRVCRDFALAYPQQIFYLYRPNGGLSAARNTGIEFALNTWHSLAAIYLLDADNRISPHTLERSYQTLFTDSAIGWVYPTIDMFGKEEGGDFDYRGEYSILRHLRFNVCEAGSMIRREVFDAGCRYDQSMVLGFEDWEFWWQAIAAGYRGKHLPESGFQYRKRFESMLSNSERDGRGITEYIKRKHRSLLTHQNILNWEQQEAPRYAIFLADHQKIILTCDPTVAKNVLSLEEFKDYYHRGRLMPVRYHRPYFLVFTNSLVLENLAQQSLIHNAFWHLELLQGKVNFAYFSLEHNLQDSAVRLEKSLPSDRLSSFNIGENDHLIMTTVKVMDECITDEQEIWIHSLITPNPIPNLSQLKLKFPKLAMADIPLANATYTLLSTFKSLRLSRQKIEPQAWDWHQNYLPARSLMFQDARLALDSRPVYPKLTEPQQKQIGFILSILEFGGVEKVALNLAKVFHDAGWQVHLFIFGKKMQQLPDWGQVFQTVNFYHEASMNPWSGEQYLGTKSDSWSIPAEQISAKGLLGWLDVAINFHNASVNNIMGQLRRAGVITVMSLHVHDLTPWNRPAGYGYLTLGYEHAYDLIMPCSDQMADWCHGMGIPEAKIIVVRNAGGYPLEAAKIKEICDRKLQRLSAFPASNSKRQLRVLFLGRFDRQKGLDRLVGIVERSRQLSLPITWKLVGKNILSDDNTAQELAAISDLIQSPVSTTDELNNLYEWADVLLLPSYWEGLPLTILEAMRLGVVICASNVGAITEVIDHEVTGFVISHFLDDSFIKVTVAMFNSLIKNPTQQKLISKAAQEYVAQNSWSKASKPLIDKLASLILDNQKKNLLIIG
jgi:glycosyltransferase involved in cell wall biosynthesis